MRRGLTATVTARAAVLALVACGGDDDSADSTPSPTPLEPGTTG
jgi:hypothetical protein